MSVQYDLLFNMASQIKFQQLFLWYVSYLFEYENNTHNDQKYRKVLLKYWSSPRTLATYEHENFLWFKMLISSRRLMSLLEGVLKKSFLLGETGVSKFTVLEVKLTYLIQVSLLNNLVVIMSYTVKKFSLSLDVKKLL